MHAILLLTSIALGSQFPASKVLLETMDPFSLTAGRVGIGALVGLGVVAVRNRLDFRVLRNPTGLVLGALLTLVYMLLNAGVRYTTASRAALFVNSSVVYVAILMFALFGERMTRGKLGGIGLSLLGLVILTTRLDSSFLSGGELIGDALVILSGLGWAGCVIVAKRAVDRRQEDALNLAGGTLSAAAVFCLLPLGFIQASHPTTPFAWSALLYLGLVTTFFPLAIFIHSIRTVSPTISSLLILPAVVVAAVLSSSLLGEPVGEATTLLGGALVLGGAYVASR